MSILIDASSAAPVATPRLRPLAGVRLHADDAQPCLTQDGRMAGIGSTYVTAKQHFSTRSGPPTSRPPA